MVNGPCLHILREPIKLHGTDAPRSGVSGLQLPTVPIHVRRQLMYVSISALTQKSLHACNRKHSRPYRTPLTLFRSPPSLLHEPHYVPRTFIHPYHLPPPPSLTMTVVPIRPTHYLLPDAAPFVDPERGGDDPSRAKSTPLETPASERFPLRSS